MMETTLYSIGHGNKTIADLVDELKSFGIKYLLDIRSKPYSKWNPHFNREVLDLELKNFGITYAFVGDSLGGLPDKSTEEGASCYDIDGKVVYEKIKEKAFFKEGLNRLITAHNKQIKVAIMCSETKPSECHRSKLIGQELLKNEISINHIIEKNKSWKQEIVMEKLSKHGGGLVDLFGNVTDFTSRKSY